MLAPPLAGQAFAHRASASLRPRIRAGRRRVEGSVGALEEHLARAFFPFVAGGGLSDRLLGQRHRHNELRSYASYGDSELNHCPSVPASARDSLARGDGRRAPRGSLGTLRAPSARPAASPLRGRAASSARASSPAGTQLGVDLMQAKFSKGRAFSMTALRAAAGGGRRRRSLTRPFLWNWAPHEIDAELRPGASAAEGRQGHRLTP